MADIKYTLIAEVDDFKVYREDFEDTASLEESGLRKAEYAVQETLERDKEYEEMDE